MFRFNLLYLYSTRRIFFQLQPKLFLFNNNICSTSTQIISFNKNNYSTSTKDNFIRQQYLFNFNPNYLHSTKIISQLQPKIISFNNEVPGHQNFVIQQNFPSLPSRYIRYITDPGLRSQHEINMASEDGTGREVTEELTQIVRECVRNEIAL